MKKRYFLMNDLNRLNELEKAIILLLNEQIFHKILKTIVFYWTKTRFRTNF